MKDLPNSSKSKGFSLLEVTIAIAIAGGALVILIGMLEPAMASARDSADQTAVGVVLEDVHDRLEGQVLEPGVPANSPLFYDTQGRFVAEEDFAETSPFFRIDLELFEFSSDARPEYTKGLLGLSVKAFWPVDEAGIPRGSSEPKTTISYPVTTLTGPDWQEYEEGFLPKIEF